MPRSTHAARLRPCGLVLPAIAVLALQTGCYKKVVGAEGFGADRIPVEQSDRPDGPIDKLIFGDEKKPNRDGGSRTP